MSLGGATSVGALSGEEDEEVEDIGLPDPHTIKMSQQLSNQTAITWILKLPVGPMLRTKKR